MKPNDLSVFQLVWIIPLKGSLLFCTFCQHVLHYTEFYNIVYNSHATLYMFSIHDTHFSNNESTCAVYRALLTLNEWFEIPHFEFLRACNCMWFILQNNSFLGVYLWALCYSLQSNCSFSDMQTINEHHHSAHWLGLIRCKTVYLLHGIMMYIWLHRTNVEHLCKMKKTKAHTKMTQIITSVFSVYGLCTFLLQSIFYAVNFWVLQ